MTARGSSVRRSEACRQRLLKTFLLRGRGGGFAAYRLSEGYRRHNPYSPRYCKNYLRRPCDIRCRMNDEKIECSELAFKTFPDATNGPRQLIARHRFITHAAMSFVAPSITFAVHVACFAALRALANADPLNRSRFAFQP